MARIIGLDLGVASIGWSFIDYNNKGEGKIIDNGVRIFDQNLQRDNEAQKGESKNAQRRMHRGMRRQRDRKRRRKRGLYFCLKNIRMMPDKNSLAEWNAWVDLNPYKFRKKGLDEQLTLYEFGRALYHLNQRRGFKSNRIAGNSDDGVVKTGISKVRDSMRALNARTLGEYLYMIKDNHYDTTLKASDEGYEFNRRIRNKYTHRDMFVEEFNALWEKQSSFYPELLTEKLKEKIADQTIFSQRPLKSQSHLIGYCSLEDDKRRIPKAHLLFQEYRIINSINNLELTDENGQALEFTDKHKSIIKGKLDKAENVKFDVLKKAIGLNGNGRFNLELGGRQTLTGNTTNKKLSAKKAFGNDWYLLDTDFKNHVVDVLMYVEKPDIVKQLAVNKWNRSPEQANYLSTLQLENNYGSLSYKALNKLLPLIKTGKRENEAIKEVYGEQKKALKKEEVFKLPMPPEIKNPVVYGALIELRKVVNAIVREYGLPDIIRVELARDLKNSRFVRNEISKKQNQFERKNKEAIKALNQSPFNYQEPSREDIIRYNLWLECNKICPYTGRNISAAALANGEFQIEHILPFSRTLDDSYANKTLCEADFNRKKGNSTPWECIEKGLLDESSLLQNIRNIPWKKRRKFIQKTIDTDEFIARQLNDTRYMSREASKYLSLLGSEEWPVKIEVTKGQSTSLIRHLWGLNSILNNDDSDIKNRDDHRHHAVDALIIALTSRTMLKKLSNENKMGSLYANNYSALNSRFRFSFPWPSFRKDAIEAINKIVVSHRVSRKISGGLHEETYYGPTKESNSKKEFIEFLVVRKRVSALSEKEIGWNKKTQSFEKGDKVFIRDDRIRHIVQNKVWELFKETGSIPLAIKKLETDPPILPYRNGACYNPIHKVRVMMEKDLTIMHEFKDNGNTPTRYALYGSNHHIAIYEYTNSKGEKKQGGEVISMMEAARRVKDKEPIYLKNHPEYDKFLFSLSANEMVLDENKNIYRVQKISSDSKVTFRIHNIALKSESDPGVLRKNPGTMNLTKIRVNPIGKIFSAND